MFINHVRNRHRRGDLDKIRGQPAIQPDHALRLPNLVKQARHGVVHPVARLQARAHQRQRVRRDLAAGAADRAAREDREDVGGGVGGGGNVGFFQGFVHGKIYSSVGEDPKEVAMETGFLFFFSLS